MRGAPTREGSTEDEGVVASTAVGLSASATYAGSATPWKPVLERLRREGQRGGCSEDNETEFLRSIPTSGPVHTPNIWPLLQAALRQVQVVFRAIWYTLDMFIVEALTISLRHGAEAYIILDAGQCSNPSCNTHLKAIVRMMEWGAHVRVKSQGTCHEKS